MQHLFTEEKDNLLIHLHGRFTFSDNALFTPYLNNIQNAKYTKVDIFLMGLEYIDSSGLGALLMLRDKCQTSSTPLKLLYPTGQVLKVFDISRFSELFDIVSHV